MAPRSVFAAALTGVAALLGPRLATATFPEDFGMINVSYGGNETNATDGWAPRTDGEDSMPPFETPYACFGLPGQFRCHSEGLCVSAAARCNGLPECADGSDEWECEDRPRPPLRPSTTAVVRDPPHSASSSTMPCPHQVTSITAATTPEPATIAPAEAPTTSELSAPTPSPLAEVSSEPTTLPSAAVLPSSNGVIGAMAATDAPDLGGCVWPQVVHQPLDMTGQPATREDDLYACQQRCKLIPSCETFAYAEATNMCHVQDVLAERSTNVAGFVGGPVDCTTQDRSNNATDDIILKYAGCFDKDTARSPMDSLPLQGVSMVDTVLDCQARCQGVESCEYWTYTGVDRRCHLAGASATVTPNMYYMVSGPKYCRAHILFSLKLSNLCCSEVVDNYLAVNELSSALASAAQRRTHEEVKREEVNVKLVCLPGEDTSVEAQVAIISPRRQLSHDEIGQFLSDTGRLKANIEALLAKPTTNDNLAPYLRNGDAPRMTAISEIVVNKTHPEEWPPHYPEPRPLPPASGAAASRALELARAFLESERPRKWGQTASRRAAAPPLFLVCGAFLVALAAVLALAGAWRLKKRAQARLCGDTMMASLGYSRVSLDGILLEEARGGYLEEEDEDDDQEREQARNVAGSLQREALLE